MPCEDNARLHDCLDKQLSENLIFGASILPKLVEAIQELVLGSQSQQVAQGALHANVLIALPALLPLVQRAKPVQRGQVVGRVALQRNVRATLASPINIRRL